MPRIHCLHTADSNVQVFDTALHELGVAGASLGHAVRADLLAAAEQAGGLAPDIAQRTADALRASSRRADAVLLTCSTLGPVADSIRASVPVLRVDAALARAAVRGGGRVAVLCAVQTTLQPTRLLFEGAAEATGAEIVVHLVPGAWDRFKAGDRRGYLAMIAAAAEEAFQGGASQVALAQASMTGAAKLATGGRLPLTSPAAGLAAAIAAAAVP